MKRIVLASAGVMALAAAAGFLGLGSFGRAYAATYQVDFDHGRDEWDGLSAARAWKHAPGDPAATGVPAKTKLHPGDHVLFAANVRYRGSIIVTASGTAADPIVFAGAEPGGRAIIDGSDPVPPARACESAADCGGAPGWRNLVRFESSAPLTDDSALFSEAGPLRPSQGPDPKDGFYRDEIDDMAPADGATLGLGRATLPHSVAAGLTSGGGRLALWVQPNVVVYRPILSIEGDVAHFDPTGLKFYTDRPDRIAAIDHVSLIDHPGEFVVLADHTTVVAMLPAGDRTFSLASGRFGFRIRAASHVVIRDLGFENMADNGKIAPGGVGIFADQAGSSGLRIENNVFRNFSSPQGQGPIILRGVSDLQIVANKFDTIALGSGIRLGGPASNILIENNEIRRVGRTAIMLMGVSDATVRGNRITDVLGVHGNGLSAYLDNHNVRFIGNTVTNAKQPATFQGAGVKSTGNNNVLFANNYFVATPDALGSLISFGQSLKGLTIRNNVLLGGKAGLRLDGGDSNVTIADNVSDGILIAHDRTADWRIIGNEWTSLSFQQEKESPRPQVPSRLVSDSKQLAHAGQVSATICAVIKRQSLAPEPNATDTAGQVGATLRCP